MSGLHVNLGAIICCLPRLRRARLNEKISNQYVCYLQLHLCITGKSVPLFHINSADALETFRRVQEAFRKAFYLQALTFIEGPCLQFEDCGWIKGSI